MRKKYHKSYLIVIVMTGNYSNSMLMRNACCENNANNTIVLVYNFGRYNRANE